MAELTREQISGLSDTEINRAMIWCYPNALMPEYTLSGKPIITYDGGHFLLAESFVGYECLNASVEIDYLTDYNLTMPLAIEHQVWLQPDCMGDGFIHAYDDNFSAKSETPLRAICEVLVMIAMEAKQ